MQAIQKRVPLKIDSLGVKTSVDFYVLKDYPYFYHYL